MNVLWLVAAVVLCGILIWAYGPREFIDQQVEIPELPADLEAYLAESESRYNDIRPGLEKTILWHDPQRKRATELSLVYLHGFSASRAEISPVPERVAQELGANLFFTRLAGHGRTGEALGKTKAGEWLRDAVEALEIGRCIGREVVLMGTSTGATLAFWLALRFPDAPMRALIQVSPNLGLRDPRSFITRFPWPRFFTSLVVGGERVWKSKNEAHAHAWTNHYPTGVGVSMVNLTREVVSCDFEKIRVSCLVIYSPKDTVVHPRKIEKSFRQLGSSKKRLLAILDAEDPDQHVITGDILSPGTNDRMVENMLKFIRSLS